MTLNLNEEDSDVSLQEGSVEDVSGHVEKRNMITLLAVVHNSPTETGVDGAVLIAQTRESKAENHLPDLCAAPHGWYSNPGYPT